MSGYRKFVIQCTLLTVLVVAVILWIAPDASADGPPPPEVPVTTTPQVTETPEATDPCFRQDPECYNPEVECADNIFVPKNPDGTWTCPPAEEPVQDCTDPMVECACDHFIDGCTGGHPPDGEGTPFPEENSAVDETSNFVQDMNPLLLGLIIVGLVLTAAGTLYMIFRRQPE